MTVYENYRERMDPKSFVGSPSRRDTMSVSTGATRGKHLVEFPDPGGVELLRSSCLYHNLRQELLINHCRRKTGNYAVAWHSYLFTQRSTIALDRSYDLTFCPFP